MISLNAIRVVYENSLALQKKCACVRAFFYIINCDIFNVYSAVDASWEDIDRWKAQCKSQV